jgi:hypothetical protein
MPFNPGGIAERAPGTLIPFQGTQDSDQINDVTDDIIAMLNGKPNLDGKLPMTALQTLSGPGTNTNHGATVGQVQSGIAGHSTAVAGTVDAIQPTFSPATTTWALNERIYWKSNGPNTIAAPTISKDGGVSTKVIKKGAGVALIAGDTGAANYECEGVYNGTDVILQNPAMAAYTVNGQTEETTTALGDFLGGYDLSGTAERKFSIQNLLKAINLLTEDTSPDEAADFLLLYDASASDVKKVKPSNLAIGAPTSISKAASQAVASTTLTNDTHLTFSIAANTKYIGKFVLDPSHTQLENFKFAITGPASPAKVTYGVSGISEETLPGTTNNVINPNPATAFATTIVVTMGGGSATIGAIIIDFLIENGSNAGPVTLQWANNATATSRSLSANSYVWYQVAN